MYKVLVSTVDVQQQTQTHRLADDGMHHKSLMHFYWHFLCTSWEPIFFLLLEEFLCGLMSILLHLIMAQPEQWLILPPFLDVFDVFGYVLLKEMIPLDYSQHGCGFASHPGQRLSAWRLHVHPMLLIGVNVTVFGFLCLYVTPVKNGWSVWAVPRPSPNVCKAWFLHPKAMFQIRSER